MHNKLKDYIINNKDIDNIFNISQSLGYSMVKNSGLSLSQIISRAKEMNIPRLNILDNPSIAVIGNSGILLEKELGKEITLLLTTIGRKVQPVSESSWDAWIKLYRRDNNSNN